MSSSEASQELFEEIHTLVSNFELENTVFRSDHASNYLVLKGTLGQDKQAMLDKIEGHITIKLNEEMAKLLTKIINEASYKMLLEEYAQTTQKDRCLIGDLEHEVIRGIKRQQKRQKWNLSTI